MAHAMVYAFLFCLGTALYGLSRLAHRLIAIGTLGTLGLGWLILRGTEDGMQGLGPVYWTVRRNGRTARPVVSIRMREIEPPYRDGAGLQFKVSPSWTFQLGFCRYMPYTDDVEVVGRWMDEADIEEIKEWV